MRRIACAAASLPALHALVVRVLFAFAAFAAFAALAAFTARDASAQSTTPFLGATGSTFSMPVRTIKQIRQQIAFRATLHQKYDFSCGSAAVATLLTYHYGRPVDEASVFQWMYASGDQAKIRREGFSLLDMKRYLEHAGYKADGVRVSLDELARVGVPAIALVSDQGYRHFVVVKGVHDSRKPGGSRTAPGDSRTAPGDSRTAPGDSRTAPGDSRTAPGDSRTAPGESRAAPGESRAALRDSRVALGDPALGGRIVSREQFESMWVGGIFFVIRSHLDVARFNVPADWSTHLAAPVALGVARESMATFSLGIPDADRF